MINSEKVIIIRDILKKVEVITGRTYKKRIQIELRASELNNESFNRILAKINEKINNHGSIDLFTSVASIISHEANKCN